MDSELAGKKGNYIESSASAMFTYGLLKGIKEGHLKKSDYLTPARKGYDLLTKEFIQKNANGTLNWLGTVEVGSLNSNGTYEVSLKELSGDNEAVTDMCCSIISACPLL